MKPEKPDKPRREALPWVVAEGLAPPAGFEDAARQIGLEFDEGDLPRLGLFLAHLLEANKSMNLTAITDPSEGWRRHILDSLTLVPYLADLPGGARVVDVGSGGGLPGVPLAITMPSLRFTLLEATGKKCEFLRRVAGELGLANVDVVCGRAERAGQDRGERVPEGGAVRRRGGHREAYDAVIARAVGRLATLLELASPLARVGGRIVLIKGARAGEELAEASRAMHLLKVVAGGRFETPTGTVLVFEKSSATPRDYPRADGEPKRSPLGGAGRGAGGRGGSGGGG